MNASVPSVPARLLAVSLVLTMGLLYGCAAPPQMVSEETSPPRERVPQLANPLPDSFLTPVPDAFRLDVGLIDAELLQATRRMQETRRAEDDSLQSIRDPLAADTSQGTATPADVRADSLSAFQRAEERLQELFGNVFVEQDSTRLRSEYALRSLTRQTFLFATDVVVYERGDTLTADTVLYDRQTKVGRARSNVTITDGDVVLTAPSAVYYTEEKRSVFPDSVLLVDGDRTLRASTGVYFSDEQRAEFAGHVRLLDPDTNLRSDSLTYLREDEVSVARGDVFIERRPSQQRTADEDTTTQTYLFGDRARNEDPRQYSRVEGRAMLVQVRADSAGVPTDTFVVQAQRLEATRTDTLRRLTAVEDVRVWQPDLAATADSLVYDRYAARAADASPAPDTLDSRLDSLRAPLDSVATPLDSLRPALGSLRRDSLRPSDAAADGEDAPSGETSEDESEDKDVPAREETRLYRGPDVWFETTQVSGDSIRVHATQRSLDSVKVWGAAFAAQEDTSLSRIQQLKGKTLTAYFRRDSLRRIVAEPNAQTIRYLGEDDGATQISSDRIVIRLRDGQLYRFSALAGVQQTYFEAGDVPDPFQLEGFRWTPEARPTRRVLADPRVQQYLRIDVATRPGRDSLRVDSLAPGSSRPNAMTPDTTGLDSLIRQASDLRVSDPPDPRVRPQGAPRASGDEDTDRPGDGRRRMDERRQRHR